MVRRSISKQPGEELDAHPQKEDTDDTEPNQDSGGGSPAAYVEVRREGSKSVGKQQHEVPNTQLGEDPPMSTRKGSRSMRAAAAESGDADQDAGFAIADQQDGGKKTDNSETHDGTRSRSIHAEKQPPTATLTPPQDPPQHQSQVHPGAEPHPQTQQPTQGEAAGSHHLPVAEKSVPVQSTNSPAGLCTLATRVVQNIARNKYFAPTACILVLCLSLGVSSVLLRGNNKALLDSREAMSVEFTKLQSTVVQLSSRLSLSEHAVLTKDQIFQTFQEQLAGLQESMQATAQNVTMTESQVQSFAATLAAISASSESAATTTQTQLSRGNAGGASGSGCQDLC
ncbi:MAG: hypothetical protein WDW38_003447 [Sanguina aurantia]